MLTPEHKNGHYHHGNLRDSAILAARKIVAAKGVTGLGLRKVAKLTGVSPAAIYRHFESLEDLTFALSERIREELGQKMVSALWSMPESNLESTVERLRVLGSSYIEFAEANPKLFGIAFLNRDDSTIDDYTDLAWVLLKQEVGNLAISRHMNQALAAALPSILWSLVHGCGSLVASESLSPREVEVFKESILKGVELLARK